MVERKAFLANPKMNIVYPNETNMIVVTITKRIEIVTGFQVCLILWMNINFKEKGEKKSFSSKSKATVLCILMRRT